MNPNRSIDGQLKRTKPRGHFVRDLQIGSTQQSKIRHGSYSELRASAKPIPIRRTSYTHHMNLSLIGTQTKSHQQMNET